MPIAREKIQVWHRIECKGKFWWSQAGPKNDGVHGEISAETTAETTVETVADLTSDEIHSM